MMTKFAALGLLTAVACLGIQPVWAEHAGHAMVTPKQLVWADAASLPAGAKLAIIEGPLTEAAPFMFRLKLPANYQVPAHWHPTVEHVTVLSGTFYMGLGDKLDTSKGKLLPVGSVAIMQPKTTHFAYTREEAVVQVHGIGPWGIHYVNPADDPRKAARAN